MGPLVITVYGAPAPQGSKKGFVRNGRVNMVESSKKVKPWREAVKWAALEALRTGPEDEQGMAERIGYPFGDVAVVVDVIFRLPRPRSHYRTGRNAHLLRDAAPRFPHGKPDIDKLLRSTLDALGEAMVWRDDSRVVIVQAQKHYGPPGARIEVMAVTAALADDAAHEQTDVPDDLGNDPVWPA